MSIKDRVSINVLNHNEFKVCATTQIQGYKFTPAVDKIPSMNPMSFAEIQNINGKSDAFRTGLLRFDPSDEKEVYEALTITDWKNIITNEFIEDAIINSTMEKLQKLIDINNTSIFDRVKTILIRLQNTGAYDISNRVINTLMARDYELQHKIYKSEIILKTKEKPTQKTDDEVASLKAQLEEMKNMMTQFMAGGNTSGTNDSEDNTKDETETSETKEPKKQGRPANRSK